MISCSGLEQVRNTAGLLSLHRLQTSSRPRHHKIRIFRTATHSPTASLRLQTPDLASRKPSNFGTDPFNILWGLISTCLVVSLFPVQHATCSIKSAPSLAQSCRFSDAWHSLVPSMLDSIKARQCGSRPGLRPGLFHGPTPGQTAHQVTPQPHRRWCLSSAMTGVKKTINHQQHSAF